MASRPLFVPELSVYPFVKTLEIQFQWFPGMAKSQSQKSIRSLHESANKFGYANILEISSKSENSLGVALSAFNLKLAHGNLNMSVECAFQGSKVFENGAHFPELYYATSLEAKKDERIRNSGNVTGFDFMGTRFPIHPTTLFYDWLYISALYQNKRLYDQILQFDAFTDIAFNPQKSLNCQARSAALYLALHSMNKLEKAVNDLPYYLEIMGCAAKYNHPSNQQLGFSF